MNDPRVVFCIEQTLGHRAHTVNIRRALATEPGVHIQEIPFPESRRRAHLPWSVEASLLTRSALRKAAWDVAVLHTQSVALLAPWLTRGKAPYVVSVDATPKQLDEMGQQYGHRRHAAPLERGKLTWYRTIFRRASMVVAWSEWAASSLVEDYGVTPSAISVLHPGATQAFFDISRESEHGRPARVLFVGGDFERKGGPALLRAADELGDAIELVIVTESRVSEGPGRRVLHGLRPGSPELIQAFADADIFCLPTLGDCTPVVIAEAMAAGLPVITTNVGSNASIVRHQDTGWILDPNDPGGLIDALRTLLRDSARSRAMGDAARRYAQVHMHADQNARNLLRLARTAGS